MITKQPINWTFLHWILKQTYPERPILKLRALLIAVMGVATIGLQFSLPLMLKHIVNTLVANAKGFTTPNVLLLCFAYGFLWIATRWVTEIREILSYRIFSTNIHTITCKIFKHLHEQSLSFHSGRDMGAIADEIKR